MDILLAIIVGMLYGMAIYMILQKELVKVIIGILILGHASNFFIFVVARLTRGAPALVPEGLDHISGTIRRSLAPGPYPYRHSNWLRDPGLCHSLTAKGLQAHRGKRDRYA
jgi:hypothetical protein